MEQSSITSSTVENKPAPGLGRRLATRLVVGAGTVGVVPLTADSLALAGRVAEHTSKGVGTP